MSKPIDVERELRLIDIAMSLRAEQLAREGISRLCPPVVPTRPSRANVWEAYGRLARAFNDGIAAMGASISKGYKDQGEVGA